MKTSKILLNSAVRSALYYVFKFFPSTEELIHNAANHATRRVLSERYYKRTTDPRDVIKNMDPNNPYDYDWVNFEH